MPDPAKTYEGTPCKAAGHTLRWLHGGACVECVRASHRAWYARNADMRRKQVRDYHRERRSDHVAYYGELLRDRRRQALKRMEARHHGQV